MNPYIEILSIMAAIYIATVVVWLLIIRYSIHYNHEHLEHLLKPDNNSRLMVALFMPYINSVCIVIWMLMNIQSYITKLGIIPAICDSIRSLAKPRKE